MRVRIAAILLVGGLVSGCGVSETTSDYPADTPPTTGTIPAERSLVGRTFETTGARVEGDVAFFTGSISPSPGDTISAPTPNADGTYDLAFSMEVPLEVISVEGDREPVAAGDLARQGSVGGLRWTITGEQGYVTGLAMVP